jgi:hypothetical protein
MWQLAWIWSLIPTSALNWINNIILIVGITGWVAAWIGQWIPFYGRYARVLKPIGIVLVILGIYMKGGYSNEMAWRDKVERLEAQVKESETKSKTANEQLSTVIKEKNKAVNDNKYIILNRIKQDAEKIDKECRIDSAALEILNDSAKMPKVKK